MPSTGSSVIKAGSMVVAARHVPPSLLPTTVVGSYPQPDWLIDREGLSSRLPPRVRAVELWRVAPELLEQAQDDATRLAIADMEAAGIDIVTDGEQRRESYSNRFATALDGVDIDNPGVAIDRTGHENPVPRVVGAISRRHPVEVRDVEFLRAHSDRRIKITLPGPFTMSQQAQDDFYGDAAELALAYAAAVNEEARDLRAAGRRDPDRRALPPGTARRQPASMRSPRSTGRLQGSRVRRRSTSVSATRRSSTTGRPAATPIWESSLPATRSRSRSSRPSRGSTSASSRSSPARM